MAKDALLRLVGSSVLLSLFTFFAAFLDGTNNEERCNKYDQKSKGQKNH